MLNSSSYMVVVVVVVVVVMNGFCRMVDLPKAECRICRRDHSQEVSLLQFSIKQLCEIDPGSLLQKSVVSPLQPSATFMI